MKKYILPLLLIILTYSCKKENIQTEGTATLEFSNDTIIFDTIFSSVGSVTKQLMVYNNNDFDITTNVRLGGVSEGNFRMNVDGESGNNIQNVTISANDSMFVFVEVTIDPINTNTPYLVSDSIIFTTGNKTQDIDLVAYGQDAYFHTANTYGDIINGEDTSRFFYHQLDCNEIWNNDKPHVIYGYVIVDPNCQLTINEGTNIYLHKNSGIIVGNPFTSNSGGTIKVNGTLGNEVTFRGDRLDSWYDSLPGQWDRIWIYPGSINNEFNYTNFQNGTIAIHADTIGNNNPTAIINNCRIDNMSAIGILGQGAKLEVNNTIITKCGQYSVVCNIGGDYTFKHCTFANYWNYDHRNSPSILLNNYYEGADGNIYVRDLNNAYFGNCIIHGSLTTEISFQENEIGNFNYTFDHSLIKIDTTDVNTNTSNFINVIKNKSPYFTDISNFDFHLSDESPCISAGDFNITQSESVLFLDLEGNLRDNVPDLGVYKK
ncbi:MAG: hypothetical protein HOH88_03410 [Flavobacteriales bacterium]|jgi:hypothetical protein|nr:hypothetical protein [Flavobacteriales bacterium]